MAVRFDLHPVRELKLDAHNPRLPEALVGRPESELLGYLLTNGALEEIAQSYQDNGFFKHEPLIILATKDADGKHIVLEGNRRLAALKIVLGEPEAADLGFAGIELAPARTEELRSVPCYAINTREELHAFLGFRHIGGIKTWEPEAKARYLLGEVDRAQKAGSEDPFRDVGRRVGSNALGVRNPYIAISILKHAREQFGIDSSYIQSSRFGVWLRLMNSPEVRDHIQLGSPKTYSEVQAALAGLDKEALAEVLGDLKPKEGRKKALLADSRDVTKYGRVIADADALKVLRKYEDLSVAAEVVDREGAPARIRRIAESCKVLMSELSRAEPSDELSAAAQELFEVVRSINSIVTGLSGDESHRG